MTTLVRFTAGISLAILLLVPLFVFGQGAGGVSAAGGSEGIMRSFGGRILTIFPCSVGVLPALHITIAPAGLLPVAYIWTATTINFLAGPPTHPGQQVLGLYATAPFACHIGPAVFPGFYITLEGTSLI